MARPPIDPAILAKALEAVADGESPASVALRLQALGMRVSASTIERAAHGLRKLGGAVVAPPSDPAPPSPVDPGPWSALRRILDARAPELVPDVVAGLDAYASGGPPALEAWLGSAPAKPAPLRVTAEQVAALRKMVAGGTFDASSIPRLAAGMGIPEAEVRAMVAEAAGAAGRDALPAELAVEESIGIMLEVRKKALEANDWKSAQAAQVHIDKVRLFARKLAPRVAT